jgi:hypothetical protein
MKKNKCRKLNGCDYHVIFIGAIMLMLFLCVTTKTSQLLNGVFFTGRNIAIEYHSTIKPPSASKP